MRTKYQAAAKPRALNLAIVLSALSSGIVSTASAQQATDHPLIAAVDDTRGSPTRPGTDEGDSSDNSEQRWNAHAQTTYVF